MPQANRSGSGACGRRLSCERVLITSTCSTLAARARQGSRSAPRCARSSRRVLRIFPATTSRSSDRAPVADQLRGPAVDRRTSATCAVFLGKTTSINHFWSLAVEEQFDLFWPFVVLSFERTLQGDRDCRRHQPDVALRGHREGWRHIVYTYPVGRTSTDRARSAARRWTAEQPAKAGTGFLGPARRPARRHPVGRGGIGTYVYLGGFRPPCRPDHAAIFVVYPLRCRSRA